MQQQRDQQQAFHRVLEKIVEVISERSYLSRVKPRDQRHRQQHGQMHDVNQLGAVPDAPGHFRPAAFKISFAVNHAGKAGTQKDEAFRSTGEAERLLQDMREWRRHMNPGHYDQKHAPHGIQPHVTGIGFGIQEFLGFRN